MKILQINASLFSSNGQSSRLTDEFVAALRSEHPQAELTVRDLAKDPVPHLDAERFGAFLAKKEERTPREHAFVDYSDVLIEELREADVIVLGLPMYNFGVPSQLKAWFDHIARAGVTFKYTEKGAVGLLGGKKVFIFAARGGIYAGTPADVQTGYVRSFLAFLGLADVQFVFAEGLALGAEARDQALAGARARIPALMPQLELAA